MTKAEKVFEEWQHHGAVDTPSAFFPAQGGAAPKEFWLPHGWGSELGFRSSFDDGSAVVWTEWCSGGWRNVRPVVAGGGK